MRLAQRVKAHSALERVIDELRSTFSQLNRRLHDGQRNIGHSEAVHEHPIHGRQRTAADPNAASPPLPA